MKGSGGAGKRWSASVSRCGNFAIGIVVSVVLRDYQLGGLLPKVPRIAEAGALCSLMVCCAMAITTLTPIDCGDKKRRSSGTPGRFYGSMDGAVYGDIAGIPLWS